MNNDWASIDCIGCSRVAYKGDKRKGVEGHSVIGPSSEVVLINSSLQIGHFFLRNSAIGFHVANAERPQCVRGQNVLTQETDHHVSICFRPGIGPIKVTFGLEGNKTILKKYKFKLLVKNELQVPFHFQRDA